MQERIERILPHVASKSAARRVAVQTRELSDMELEAFIGNMKCPICGGGLIILTVLGRTTHYRCRRCGADFRQEVAERPTGETKRE